ncbi:hypothetical protein Tco_1075407 [Tanacetum coccineum]
MVENLEQRQEDEDNSKMENLKHLKIPFKEIFSATNGFADSRMIGWGGFGEEKAKLLLSGEKLRLIKEGKNSGKK